MTDALDDRKARCAICGKVVSAQFWICRGCETLWELRKPFEQWPDWARTLVLEFEQPRRRNAEIAPELVSLEQAEAEGFAL